MRILIGISFAFVVIACLLIGCSRDDTQILGSSGSKLSPIEKEALNRAMPRLSALVAKCGDSWTISTSGRLFQYTQAVVTVSGDASEADRLNGIEWKGTVEYCLGGSVRSTIGTGEQLKRAQWQTANLIEGSLVQVEVIKAKGGQLTITDDGSLTNISCFDIPK